jgi:hypothetical protein
MSDFLDVIDNPSSHIDGPVANPRNYDYIPIVAGWDPVAVDLASVATFRRRKGTEATFDRPDGPLLTEVTDPAMRGAALTHLEATLRGLVRRTLQCRRLTANDIIVIKDSATDSRVTGVVIRGSARIERVGGATRRLVARRTAAAQLAALRATLNASPVSSSPSDKRAIRRFRERLTDSNSPRRIAAIRFGIGMTLGALIIAGLLLTMSGGNSTSPTQQSRPGPATLSSPEGTFRVGEPGDDVFLGDWNGDGIETPGVFRRSSGELFVWDSWKTTARGEPGRLIGRHGQATTAKVVPCEEPKTCDVLTVDRPSLPSADTKGSPS